MDKIEKPTEQTPSLEELRGKIDFLDKKLFSVLAERMDLIPKIAEYKKVNGIPRVQPGREKSIIESRRKIAEELRFNPDLAESIMKLIIEDAHRIEIEIMDK